MNLKNQKSLDATKNQNAVAYANSVIDMTLNSKRKDKQISTFDPATNEIINWQDLTKSEERELYSFVSRHAYIQDIIAGVITEQKAYIDDSDPDFYSITLTRAGAEYFGTDNIKSMNNDLWNDISYIAKHPTGLKSLPIKINEDTKGRIILQPYVVKITYEPLENENLKKKHENAPTQRIKEVRIMFAKYLYKDLYEQGECYTKLGKCLFAKIKYLINFYEKDIDENGNILDGLNRYKTLLTDEEIKKFTQWKENPLNPIQIYKAILYFARHDNSKDPNLTYDVIDFCNSVEPSVLKIDTVNIASNEIDENGNNIIIGQEDRYFFKDSWYKEKLKLDIYARFFNLLSKLKQINGMKFTTCKTWLDREKMKININFERNDN